MYAIRSYYGSVRAVEDAGREALHAAVIDEFVLFRRDDPERDVRRAELAEPFGGIV